MPSMITGIPMPLLGFSIPGIPKILTDPWGYIQDKLTGLYNDLGELFQKYVFQPPGAIPDSFRHHEYAKVFGLSLGLGTFTLMFLLIGSIFVRKWVFKAGDALKKCVLVSLLGPFFYELMDFGVKLGSDITAQIIGDTTASKLVLLPKIDNVFGAIFGIMSVGFWGGLTVGIFLIYVIAIYLATYLALPLYVLSPLGRPIEFTLRMLISLYLVAAMFGRWIGALELKISATFIDHLPKDTPWEIPILILTFTFMIVIITQLGLIFTAYKGVTYVYNEVKSKSNSWIRGGDLQTTQKPGSTVDVNVFNERRAAQAAAVMAMADHVPALAVTTAVAKRISTTDNKSTHTLRPRQPSNGNQPEQKG